MGKPRILIVGLDGATHSILQPLIKQGKLPTLARIQRDGIAGPLASVTPPITPAAWSSFYTGKNPGKHGVYEFLYRRPESYEKVPVNSTAIRAKKFWDYADAAGLRTCLFNLPLLYPTAPINGVAISGLLTPDSARDFGKPDGIIAEIESALGKPYLRTVPSVYEKGKLKQLLDHFHQLLTYHIQTALYLYRKERWDLFFGHIMVTDTMQHELWHVLDPTHSAHDPKEAAEFMPQIEAIYQRIDAELLSPLLAEMGDDSTMLIMSDHGFGGIEHIIYMNMWLLHRGYIQWLGDWWTQTKARLHRWGVTPRNLYRLLRTLGLGWTRDRISLDARERWLNRGFMNIRRADWSKTRAYSMGNILGMLYINLRGREPEGIVEPGAAYEQIRQELTEQLLAERLPGTDQPMFAEISRGETLYHGPYAQAGPDLVCIPTDWRYQVFGYQDFVSNRFLEPFSEMTGHHRPDGILFGYGSRFQPGVWVDGARLLDIVPTAFHLLGLPIPEDMDGQVLQQLFPANHRTLPTLQAGEALSAKPMPAQELTAAQQAEVMARLRALGYED